MSSDIGWRIRDKLRPMPIHGSVLLYRASTETIRLVRTASPGRPPRLSHSSWTVMAHNKLQTVVYDVLPSTTINHDGYSCARHYRHAWLGRKPVSFHSTLFQSRFEPSLWPYPSNSHRNCSGITDNLEGMATWVFCLRTSASWRWRWQTLKSSKLFPEWTG